MMGVVPVVVCPGAELELTVLLVKREVVDVDLAGGVVDGGREPVHRPVGVHLCRCLLLDVVSPTHTGRG